MVVKQAYVAVICSVPIMLFMYLILAIINSYCKQDRQCTYNV